MVEIFLKSPNVEGEKKGRKKRTFIISHYNHLYFINALRQVNTSFLPSPSPKTKKAVKEEWWCYCTVCIG